jgi:hypothetical protein
MEERNGRQSPGLYTVQQTSERYPAFSQSALRFLIFNAEPRKNSRNETIPGNGLGSAIIRIGRKVLIDETKFLEWIESHRCEAA